MASRHGDVWLVPPSGELPPALIERLEAAGSGALLLVPGGARRRALATALTATGAYRAAGAVATLEAALEPVAGARARIGGAGRLALLAQVIGDDPRLLGGEPTPGVVRELGALLDELGQACVGDLPEDDPLLLAVGAWRLGYRTRLANLGAVDRVAALEVALAALDVQPRGGEGLGRWGGQLLALDDPGAFTPLELRLIHALRARARELHVLVPAALPGVAFARARAIAEALAPEGVFHPAAGPTDPVVARLFAEEPGPRGEPPDQHFMAACGSRREEMVAAGELVVDLVRGGKVTHPSRIALVVPDTGRYLALAEEVLPGMGIPASLGPTRELDESPAGALFLGLLLGAARGWPAPILLAVLRSPLIDRDARVDAALLARVARRTGAPLGRDAWLAAVARAAGAVEVLGAGREAGEVAGPGETAAALAERTHLESLGASLAQFFARVAPLEAAKGAAACRQALEAIARGLRVVPRMLAGQEGRLAARDVAATQAFFALLDELSQVESGDREAPGIGAIARLVETARGQAGFSAPGKLARGPLLATPAEAAGESWEGLVVLGLEEGAFPRAGIRPPLVDGSTHARLGLRVLPRYQGEDREGFVRLLATRGRALLLTRARQEQSVPLLPSAFWMAAERALEWGPPPAGPPAYPPARAAALADALLAPAPPAVGGELATAALVAAIDGFGPSATAWAELLLIQRRRARGDGAERFMGCLEDPALLALLARRYHPGYQFSITALEDYAQCPFKFFARRLLRLEEPEEGSEAVDLRVRGELLHRILFLFLRDFVPTRGRVRLENLAEAGVSLRAIAERELAGWGEAGVFWERERAQLLGDRRVPGILPRWLALEAERVGEFKPARLEWGFGDVPGSEQRLPPLRLDAAGAGSVLLRGRVDRIDALPGGQGFAVIDYKGGSVADPIPKVVARIRLQLALYMAAAHQLEPSLGPPLGAVYVQLASPRKVGLAGPFGDAVRVGPGGELPLLPKSARKPRSKQYWQMGAAGEPGLASFLAETAARAARLAVRLRSGRFLAFRHPADHDCVHYCPFRDVCRVEETSRAADFSAEVTES